MPTIVTYEERWIPAFVPFVFFLPCFYKYSVSIKIGGPDTLTFGYGFNEPWMWTAHTMNMKDIDQSSIYCGFATWKENLVTFGGWGIRIGKPRRRSTVLRSSGLVWAYNPSNGAYVEFMDSKKGTRYRFSSRNAIRVAEILRGYDEKKSFSE